MTYPVDIANHSHLPSRARVLLRSAYRVSYSPNTPLKKYSLPLEPIASPFVLPLSVSCL